MTPITNWMMEWTWQIADFMVARLRDENTNTEYRTPPHVCTHTHTHVSVFSTQLLFQNWSAAAATHTGWEQSLWEQTYMIVEASHSSTLTLSSLESQLNNLDLLSSAKTSKSQSYDVIGVRGQGCDAYTARLPAVIQQKPDFVGLVPTQNCRETRSGSSAWPLEWGLTMKIRPQKSNCYINL